MNEARFDDSNALGVPADIARSEWVVLKFGGTSISTAANWQRIAGLLARRLQANLRPVVVHSALAGVSDELETLLEHAVRNEDSDVLDRLRERHVELAAELGLNRDFTLDDLFDELTQLAAGIRLIREVSVRVRVRVMALGELMASRIAVAYLAACGLPVTAVDARELLISRAEGHANRDRNYLAAVCDYAYDEETRTRLAGLSPLIVTQGFIARNEQGETVLLGRGGSDTSAAYLAARLGARRLEIWTDVPGMFTANPRRTPSARLLASLRYDEAQELASAGSSVLHPRCLSPLRNSGIPLFLRCTEAPDLPGTVISAATEETEPQVKGICLRSGLTLISMTSVGMWHEAGFLARAFAVFGELGVSVDLVSTSGTNVTVSIDTADGGLEAAARDALVEGLSAICRVKVIDNCAAVSLVGRKIRTIMPRLAPALEVFEEERVHLMSQAANDLNLTFVIDAEQGPRLVGKLHSSIIPAAGGSAAFGPSWESLSAGDESVAGRVETWWSRRRAELLRLAEQQPNAYVYDRATVQQAARGLKSLTSVDRVLYAVKANFNPTLLRTLDEEGVDFECVSPGEVRWLEEELPDFDVSRVLFTPNFAPREEYAWGLGKGLLVTLDNLFPLEAWPELFDGRRIAVRVDPGQGRGHHEHVKTAGVHSKFGIPRFEVAALKALVARAGASVVGIHAHSGSGILDPMNWHKVAAELVQVADEFPDVDFIDLGGGLGIPEKPGDKPFDLARLDALLAEFRAAHPKYRLWLEPGRYLVAQSGVLLTHVTQTKGKGDMRYVGVGTGMNSLIRPALYGAYHEIVNLTRYEESATVPATVVGPICETGDRLGSDRLLPLCQEGDVILVANTGAYGHVMSSRYNLRDVATEIII